MRPATHLAITTLLTCAFLTAQAEEIRRASLAPTDAKALVSISDTSEFFEKLSASPVGRLLKDPEFKDFLGNPDWRRLTESALRDPSSSSDEISALVYEQMKLLKGELVLAFRKGNEKRPSIAALAAVTREEYEKALDIDRQIADIEEDRTTFINGDFMGIPYVETVREKENLPEHYWQAFVNGTLVESDDREWFEKTLSALKNATVLEPDGTPQMELTFSRGAITEGLEKAITHIRERQPTRPGQTNSTPAPVNVDGILEGLGLSGLRDFSCILSATDAETRLTTRLNASRSDKGIWTIIPENPESIPEPEQPFVPDDIYSWKVSKFDALAFWEEIPTILNAIDPTLAGYFQILTGMTENMYGVNLGKDVFANMDNSYTAFSKMDAGESTSLAYWSLKNPQAFGSVLSRLFSEQSALRMQFGNSLSVEDFKGRQIFLFSLPQGPGTKVDMAVCVADNELMAGNADLVRSAIRGLAAGPDNAAGFRNTPAFRRLMRDKPDDAYSYSYLDWNMFLRQMLTPAARTKLRMWHAEVLAGDSGDTPELLKNMDIDKLPSAERIASFFSVSISYARSTPDSLESLMVILNPENPASESASR